MSHHSVKPNPDPRIPKDIPPMTYARAAGKGLQSQRQAIVDTTEASEPSNKNAKTALRAGTSEVRTNTKDEYARNPDFMGSISKVIENAVLGDIMEAGHEAIYKLKRLGSKLYFERHHAGAPPGFEKDLLSPQSLAFIDANMTSLPVHHAFVTSLKTCKITIDVWELACTINGKEFGDGYPKPAPEEFEAVGRAYAASHELDDATRAVLRKLCLTARDIIEGN